MGTKVRTEHHELAVLALAALYQLYQLFHISLQVSHCDKYAVRLPARSTASRWPAWSVLRLFGSYNCTAHLQVLFVPQLQSSHYLETFKGPVTLINNLKDSIPFLI